MITDGIPNHYGKERQRHKTRMNTYGHSKLSRAPFNTRGPRARKKGSDGRPPDTKKELLGRRPSKATTRKKPLAPKKLVYQRSYPWQDNSCWLDSSLKAIFAACSHDPEILRARFTPLPEIGVVHSRGCSQSWTSISNKQVCRHSRKADVWHSETPAMQFGANCVMAPVVR